MSCERCGSWSVRRDRSLAGRLVCGRCGQPLTGGRRRRGSAAGPGWRPAFQRARPWSWIAVVLLGSGALLALIDGDDPGRIRPLRPARQNDRFSHSGGGSQGRDTYRSVRQVPRGVLTSTARALPQTGTSAERRHQAWAAAWAEASDS
jgi:hypothetical protein